MSAKKHKTCSSCQDFIVVKSLGIANGLCELEDCGCNHGDKACAQHTGKRYKRREYTQPRYDDIYYEGLKWLDSLS